MVTTRLYTREFLLAKLDRFGAHELALLIELANHIEERRTAKASGSIEFSTDREGVTFLPKRTLHSPVGKIA